MQEFDNLIAFSKYINVPLPIDEDFTVMRIEDYYNTFSGPLPEFRHKFYAVSLYENIGLEINIGLWKLNPKTPFMLFKSPHQVLAWNIHPGELKGWFVMFTEKFLIKNKQMAQIIHDFPFLQLDKAIPFEIEETDVPWLSATYHKIHEEYHSDVNDRFALIVSYVQTLLLQVKRLYEARSKVDVEIAQASFQQDQVWLGRFKRLLADISDLDEFENRSVTYFAGQLAIHPNHLNAIIKRVTGSTALQLIHDQIMDQAKLFLNSSELSVKEIAYRLAFKEPTHFVKFFKKNSGATPLEFRIQKKV
ncbi:AraC family transcriptional regulator [Flavobacterium psychroterrae]|uniref:AraC family transcriptional regulator n=1 Tax=Flavobacterium psychroterrae TaxID=2133767 RepID=A0ABS5PFD8_9FLAO|nr:helix-turn-helix domain-containing protein [Flavobacterium psychroterrae]MBS7232625.1 AraC family transcriptional regulator [Flavobacterium psychroterrae]